MTNPNPQIQISTSANRNISIGNDLPLTILAGPCVLESRDHAMMMAAALKDISEKLGVNIIYKTSFDKANRTSLSGVRGMGLADSLPIFEEVKREFDMPVLTDVHTADQCAELAPVIDVLQIPAFLCRQTDLLIAAAKTGRVINVKKGQFLAPWDMKNVINKVVESGNANVMACERGASFGYNTLISDMRAIPIMRDMGCPVVFDATHSVQQPGGLGGASGGQREFVPHLARAAVSIGVAAVFMETHQDPDNAPSDGPNMIKLNEFEGLLADLMAFDQLAKARNAEREQA